LIRVGAKVSLVRHVAIITPTPNKPCAELHNRMAVALEPDAWDVRLGEEPAEASALKACWRHLAIPIR
jgi:putative SOS response-associated peptidase YedK